MGRVRRAGAQDSLKGLDLSSKIAQKSKAYSSNGGVELEMPGASVKRPEAAEGLPVSETPEGGDLALENSPAEQLPAPSHGDNDAETATEGGQMEWAESLPTAPEESPSASDTPPLPESLKTPSLPIDAINLPGINPRLIDETSAEFLQLVASVQVSGIIEPLVIDYHDGKYWLIAGERRFRAAKMAGLSEVPVTRFLKGRENWSIAMLSENLHRQELELWEEARAYQSMVQAGKTQKEIAAELAVSDSYISTTMKMARNAQAVRALQKGLIPHKTIAMELSPLVLRDGTERWPGALDAAVEFIAKSEGRVTSEVVRAWVNEVKANDGVASEEPSRKRARAERATFLRKVERQFATELARAKELSRLEIQLLVDLHKRQVEALTTLTSEDLSE